MSLVGVFGGTFDPLHIGHLRVAEEVRESYSLRRIYFVPSSTPPHKKGRQTTDPDDRLEMARRAVRGNRFFRVSDEEIKRGGVSYTIDTLLSFGTVASSLFFLIGIDAFAEVDTWHRYRDLFSHTNFVVMVRPDPIRKAGIHLFPADLREDMAEVGESTFRHKSGKMVYFHRVTQLDVSATRIRENVRRGHSIRYLVPRSVERFIEEKGLYRG